MAATTQSPSFSFEGAYRPLPVRVTNAVGGRFGRTSRRLISLSPDSLLRAAERKTGLDAHGDDALREPLERLLDSLETDARLNTFGRWAVRDQILDLLCQRLRVRDHLARHREVLDVPLERPVLILGFPRTGSTFLHNLMALDPANRVPKLWEVLNPVPPEDSRDGSEDPRLEEAREYVRSIQRMSPVALKIHPMSAEGPEECRFLLEKSFVGLQFIVYYRVPRYIDWFIGVSDERLEAACLEVRRQMQIIKHGDAGRRWVGKSTGHVVFGRGLMRAFPDACVVQIHRDPAEAVPSICGLAGAYRSIFSDHVEPRDLGEEALRLFGVAMDRAVEMHSMPPPASFCDIRYDQIVSDPVGVVRRIYDHAGMSFSAEVEGRIERYVAAHPQHKGGVHRYSPEQYGLSLDEIRKRTERHAGWLEGFGR